MKIGKKERRINLTLKGQRLEQVENFRYLEGLIKSNGSCTEEIRSRIGMGKIAFEKVKDLLTTRRIPLKLRKRFAKCYVWSVVLYGAETWTRNIWRASRCGCGEGWKESSGQIESGMEKF
jgi:hypothetical protein